MITGRHIAWSLAGCILLACCQPALAERPRRKMIEAVTAIDVSAGVERIECRAALPWAMSQALVYAGVRTGYAEFCAVSGWSAEFHHRFSDPSAAAPSLHTGPASRCFSRGAKLYGKRLEMFAWPEVTSESDRLLAARAAWEFILSSIAADRPVLCDYLEGGVLYGYDETMDEPVVYFNTTGPGFGALKRSRFSELFLRELFGLAVIADAAPGPDARALLVGVLANLIVKAAEGEDEGAPANLAAMRALAADLLDRGLNQAAWGEAVQRPLCAQGEARLCTAVYLRRSADLLGEAARRHLIGAAEHYEQAYEAWWKCCEALGAGAGAGREQAAAGRVHQAIGSELLALAEVSRALALVEGGR